MTRTAHRQFKHMKFTEAVAMLEIEYKLAPERELIIRRDTGERDHDGVPIYDVYCWDQVSRELWTMEEITYEEWIFEDITEETPEELKPAETRIEGADTRSFTREQVISAVSFIVGRWHYNNPDSKNIARLVADNLGFPP